MSDIWVVLSVDLIILIDGRTCESLAGYSWFGLDYLSYWRQSYYESNFIDIDGSYWSTLVIGDLEGGYMYDFENLSSLYTLLELFYPYQQVITYSEYHNLPEKLNWLYMTFTWKL